MLLAAQADTQVTAATDDRQEPSKYTLPPLETPREITDNAFSISYDLADFSLLARGTH